MQASRRWTIKGRIPPDAWEPSEAVQDEVSRRWNRVETCDLADLADAKCFQLSH